MAVNSFSSNQGTQSALLTDNTGGVTGTLIPIMKISTDGQGTFTNGNLWSGAVTITAGSINGTVNVGNTPNIGTIGTLGLGSVVVNTLPNLPNGSIIITNGTIIGNGGSMIGYGPAAAAAAAIGNPLNIGGTDSGGTIRTIKVDAGGLQRIGIDSGTISVLPNLPQGSINVTAGTIASVGTIGTLGLGTITGNLGTIGTLGLGSVVVNSLPNLPQGSINVTAGTIATLGTMGTLGTLLNQGSLTNVGQIYNAGTLQAGTVQINQLPTQAMTAYGTMGTQASGTTFFTIQGTVGAGTEAIVSDWSIVVMAGTCGVSLSFGTNGGSFVQGTGVIGAGSFPAGGGLAQSVESALNSGTNGQIFAGLYGNGTAYYHISYYKATTTI